jgi:hypothetical protein
VDSAGGLTTEATLIGPKGVFFFYLAAVICFVLAAIGEPRIRGRLGRPSVGPGIAFVPLGLALFVFPQMWNLGHVAF